jgi:hypothetical protein
MAARQWCTVTMTGPQAQTHNKQHGEYTIRPLVHQAPGVKLAQDSVSGVHREDWVVSTTSRTGKTQGINAFSPSATIAPGAAALIQLV